MTVENKKKIINNMLKNGAILYKKNTNDNRDLIEFVKNMPESREKYELVNFIEEKNKALLKKKEEKLKSEEEKLNNELKKLKGKKFVFFRKSRISKLEKKINKNKVNLFDLIIS